ncbi:hypothetical protein MMC26_005556 [Xylographa opegraphella]|nr:hypothetical protein [Xylographa opegraphella]
MPAMLDDPLAPPLTRSSGPAPFPTPGVPFLPPTIIPRQVTLRDRITIATLLPFSSPEQVPPTLLAYLSDQLNREIEKGDTYPMLTPIPLSVFGGYWFGAFGAVMVLGPVESVQELSMWERSGRVDWARVCLGSFYVKPNYPGRSSHVCNGGFLVTDNERNKGVGRLMGEGYLEWAPKLGYTYSVFNLVYETNLASCRIWDALGFKRIGRVPRCGALCSHPDTLIDAIIYGRDLGPDGEDFVSEERFDKIRYYLKHGKYPAGADRAEKSRLRSAATHYKLLPPAAAEGEEAGGAVATAAADGEERLMLKDKEVVADAQRQYEIARAVHAQGHGGINKTTATIAERFHWVRIKETVSLAIRNCVDCKEGGKLPVPGGQRRADADPNARIERLVVLGDGPAGEQARRREGDEEMGRHAHAHAGDGTNARFAAASVDDLQGQGGAPVARMRGSYGHMQIDPQIMAAAQGMGAYGAEEEGDGERDGVGEEEFEMEMGGADGDGEGGVGQRLMEAGFGGRG